MLAAGLSSGLEPANAKPVEQSEPQRSETRQATPPSTRLETEYKLAVPAGQETAVWRWLNGTYARTKPQALGAGWATASGTETFHDRYFDDTAHTLLRARAGLRHRRRFEADGTLKKQLVQLKITNDTAGMLRQELKFKLAGGAAAATPLADLLQSGERSRLDVALAGLGVVVPDLTQEMDLGQRRRRLYLRLNGDDFATLTLDSSYHIGLPTATFTEVEVELNEKRFTAAAPAERVQMQALLTGIRADLLRQFPEIIQDQRPKYTKLAALLDKVAPTAAEPEVVSPIHSSPVRPVPTWVFAGLGVFTGILLVSGVKKWRARR